MLHLGLEDNLMVMKEDDPKMVMKEDNPKMVMKEDDPMMVTKEDDLKMTKEDDPKMTKEVMCNYFNFSGKWKNLNERLQFEVS
jgi:hypothetical protein